MIIRIEATIPLEPRYFFEDSDVSEHKDATAHDCAAQIANYVEDHGMSRFLIDWNLDDITVSVDDVEAVVKGIPETSNQESGPK